MALVVSGRWGPPGKSSSSRTIILLRRMKSSSKVGKTSHATSRPRDQNPTMMNLEKAWKRCIKEVRGKQAYDVTFMNPLSSAMAIRRQMIPNKKKKAK